MNEQDITKIGPVGLKGLNRKSTEEYILEDLSRLRQRASKSNPSTVSSIYSRPAITNAGLELANVGYGKSVYDEGVTEADINQLQDIRAMKQSGFVQAVNGIAKMVGTGVTTFVEGTAGLLYGLGDVAIDYHNRGDGTFGKAISRLWDNDVSQAMASVNNVMEELMPNYYTQYQQENPLSWDALASTNMVFDKIVKNLGFMIGAAYSGGLYTKAIEYGARGLSWAKAAMAAKRGLEVTDKARKAGEAAMQALQATRTTKATVGSFFNALAEGSIEAVNNSNDWAASEKERLLVRKQDMDDTAMSEYIQSGGIVDENGNPVNDGDPLYARLMSQLNENEKASRLAMQEIENNRHKVGNMDLALNLPLLWVGDIITLGKAYAGGWKATRNTAKAETRATREALREATQAVKAGDREALNRLQAVVRKAEETGYRLTAEEAKMVEVVAPHLLGPKTQALLKAGLQPLKEGQEEMSQAAVATASGLLYQQDTDRVFNAALGIEDQDEALDFWGALSKGFSDQYGNANNYQEFLLGAITGLFGSPTFGRTNNSTDQTWLGRGKLVGFTGGVFTEYRDAVNQRKEEAAAINRVNETLRSGYSENALKHLISQIRFSKDKKRAIIHDDKKEYKDAETAAFFEDITYFKKVGRLDLLERMLRNSEAEFSDEEIAELVRQQSEEISAYNNNIRQDSQRKDSIDKEIVRLRDIYNQSYNELVVAGYSPEEIEDLLKENQDHISMLKSESEMLGKRITDSSVRGVSPYLKSDDTLMSNDEVRQELKERKEKIGKIIDSISQSQSEIDAATAEALTEEQLSTLTWHRVMMRDWQDRADGIFSDIRRLVERVNNNPVLRETLRQAEEALQSFSEEHPNISAEDADRIFFGGDLLALRNHFKNIGNIFEYLTNGTLSGIELAKALSDNRQSNKEFKEKTGFDTYGEYLHSVLEDVIRHNSELTKEQQDNSLKDLQDLREIGKSYSRYNELLEEYLSNPSKIDEAHTNAKRKSAEARVNKRRAEKTQQLSEKTPSEINQALDDGDISVDELDDIAEGLDDIGGAEGVKDSIEEAKAIRNSHEKIKKDLDRMLANGEITKQQHDDAIKLLEKSSKVANSVDEFLDTDSEAFLDANELDSFMEDRPDNGDVDYEEARTAVQDNKERRADEARTIVRTLSDKQKKEAQESKKIPDVKPTPYDPKKDIGETGHDSVDRVAPYTPETTDDANKNDEFTEPVSASESDMENAEKQTTNNGFNSQADIDEAAKEGTTLGMSAENGTYNYWRPSTSQYARGTAKGEHVPFWTLEKDPTKRAVYKAIYEFLEKNGVFDRVNNNGVKKGDKIRFAISKSLNSQAGTVVVLMIDKDGKVIGDLPTLLDASHSAYPGLDQLIIKATAFQEENQDSEDDLLIIPDISSTIARNMIGQPMYSESSERRTLNEINVETASNGTQRPTPFKIGINVSRGGTPRIMVTPGRRQSEGISKEEMKVVLPLTAAKGQPFMLMQTSREGRQVCVPITMRRFLGGKPSRLEQIVIDKLNELSSLSNDLDKLLKWKDEIRELLALDEMHVDFSIPALSPTGRRESVLTITMKRPGDSKSIVVFKGPKSALNMDEFINTLKGLELMFNISRKYINTTYGNEDYNTLIGEVAETNLLVGATHTVNDWFTLNPIVDGKEQKAHVPKSTKTVQRTISKSGDFIFNHPSLGTITLTEANTLLDSNGNELRGENYNTTKAYLYGLKTQQSMTVPYKTPWGEYNPSEAKFVEQSEHEPPKEIEPPIKTDAPVEQKKEDKPEPTDRDAAKKILTDSKLLTPVTAKALDKASDATLIALSKLPKAKLRTVLGALKVKLRPNSTGEDIDNAINKAIGKTPLNREVRKESIEEKWDRKKEEARIAKILPQLSEQERIKIVDGLIRIAGRRNPSYAWGQFVDGVITISSDAARGTLYHEAFHFVTQSLMSNRELNELYAQARKKYGKKNRLALEEQLAEDFREYMQKQEDMSIFQRIFSSLRSIINAIRGNEPYIETVFKNIRKGKYSNRETHDSKATLFRTYSEQDYERLVNKVKSSQNVISRIEAAIQQNRNLIKQWDRTFNDKRFSWRTEHGKRFKRSGLMEREQAEALNKEYRYTGRVIQDRNLGYRVIFERDSMLRAIQEKENSLMAELQEAEVNLAMDEYELDSYDSTESSRKIRDYYYAKLAYNNLTSEQKEFLAENQITPQIYMQYSRLEREMLFRCS